MARIKFKLKRTHQNIIMIILLLLGVGILVYPDIANWWHANRHEAMNQAYNAEVERMRREEIEYELDRARVFNEGLTGIHVIDPFIPGSGSVMSDEYYSILNFTDGMMGRIEIPKIDVNLPIFHGTSDRVLARGAGHMENTPFPIGGYGNHSIITAHTGMINMRLFTYLDRLDYGDEFFVQVLDHRVRYVVDRITEVLPDEIETLVSYDDRDLITLVTCTPYGINTYRLLVRGTRVEYIPGGAGTIPSEVSPLNLRLIIVIGFSILFALIIWSYGRKKKELVEAKKFDEQIEREYEELQRGGGHA